MVKGETSLKQIPVIIIVGPTASGKSKLALLIAKKINGCIINADSRQIYKDCYIGTNSPTKNDIKEIEHFLYNFLDPSYQFSAAEYAKLALINIKNIYSKNKIAILVGGAGLYIKALLEGLFQAPGKNTTFRNNLKNITNIMGNYFIFEQLKTIDPIASQKISANDLYRIIRALEIFYLTGKSKSELIQNQKYTNILLPMKIGIMPPKTILYENIETRTNLMIQNGLIEEVKFLIHKYPLHSPIFNTIGYKEIILFLQNKINIEEAIKLINRNTKLYAKRQITWFKKDKNIIWLTNNIQFNDIINKINAFLQQSNIINSY